MKRIKLNYLVLLIMVICAMTAGAHDFYSNRIYYVINGDEVSVSYRGDSYTYTSGEYQGDIVIPDSVTWEGITYPVTGIIRYAFCDCPKLNSVTISKSVVSMDGTSFIKCPSLTSLVVEDGNPVYDSREDCKAVIETASNTLVAGCMNSVFLNSITAIGDYAFYGCTGLTSAHIPNCVTSIGEQAFAGCSGITSLTIPNTIAIINTSAFAACSGLTSIEIPNSVTNIRSYAFSGCSGLTSIHIPSSVTSIGYSSFVGCLAATSMTVASDNPVFDSRDNCNAIIKTATNTLLFGCQATIIPSSVTEINRDAFYYCKTLKNITIPNSVTTIGAFAFDSSGLTSITIPNSVTSIAGQAFCECTELKSLTLPNSITRIENSTFRECDSLAVVVIPNSVTYIGGNAFSRSAGRKRVIIPSSVTKIENEAFLFCPQLSTVYCLVADPSRITMGTNVFYLNSGTEIERTLYVPAGSTELYQANSKWSVWFDHILEITPDGDANGDGVVDIDDITMMINAVLGNTESGFIAVFADVNSDNSIDIDDVTIIINNVLGNQ